MVDSDHNLTSQPEPIPDIDLAGITVLIADDEADARTFVGRVIADAGGSVVEAIDGSEVLALLDARVPDVLICDIGMPGTDGYALIRQIRDRRDDRQRNVAAIALTGFAQSEDRRRALLAGYQSHLAKPVDTIDLIVEVASLCGRARVGD